MIILFSGCDKVKGFNTRIKEVINKELDMTLNSKNIERNEL